MTISKLRILSIVGGIALLSASFALGFIAGSQSQKASIKTPATFSSLDMERAFGSANSPSKPADHAAMQGSATQEPAALSLGSLVAGLEKKVASHPENIDQQLLLAQTYNELGDRTKCLKLLHVLNKQAPKDAQVKITLATVLMKGEETQELKEALQVFDEAIKLQPDAASMARLYQGEIKVKLDSMKKN